MSVIVERKLPAGLLLYVIQSVAHSGVPLVVGDVEVAPVPCIVHDGRFVEVEGSCKALVIAPEHEAIGYGRIFGGGNHLVDDIGVLEIRYRISLFNDVHIFDRIAEVSVGDYVDGAEICGVLLKRAERYYKLEVICLGFLAERYDYVCHGKLLFPCSVPEKGASVKDVRKRSCRYVAPNESASASA